MAITNNLDQLVIARRLMVLSQRAEDRRKGKPVDEKSLRVEMEEDRALLSGNLPTGQIGTSNVPQKTLDMSIQLSDLITQLKSLENLHSGNDTQSIPADPQSNRANVQQNQVNFQQVVDTQVSLSYTSLQKIDGLVRQSQTLAETDRYSLDFSNGTTFKITDKWSNRSTTIWGDPHVDVSDVEGTNNGDFQDLKTSNSQTTLMLLDGTRVTFTAKDDGLIESVDIFKGNQHLSGTGEGSNNWSKDNQFFTAKVDNASISSALPMGDTVYAGGDGNDWYTSNGKLLWGQTTGPEVKERPASVLQMEYRQTIRKQVVLQVNKQA